MLKALSCVLRHDGLKRGIHISPDGDAPLNQVFMCRGCGLQAHFPQSGFLAVPSSSTLNFDQRKETKELLQALEHTLEMSVASRNEKPRGRKNVRAQIEALHRIEYVLFLQAASLSFPPQTQRLIFLCHLLWLHFTG